MREIENGCRFENFAGYQQGSWKFHFVGRIGEVLRFETKAGTFAVGHAAFPSFVAGQMISRV